MVRQVKFKRPAIRMIWIAIIMLLVLTSVAIVQLEQVKQIESKNGVLDLNKWESMGFQHAFLAGEWEFYWEKFLNDSDFNEQSKPDAFVKIPSVWNRNQIPGKDITGKGYATYRLHVKNANIGEAIGFRMSPLSTAYRMYIDDQLVAQNGVIGTSEENAKGEYRIQVFHYTPDKKEFDIIIQISNYVYARGGFWYAPEIGRPEYVDAKDRSLAIRDAFIIGCSMLILIDSLFIFLIRRKEKSRLYLGIMCLGVIFRTMVYSSHLITRFTLLSDLKVLVRIEYISLAWMILTFVLLSNSQYPNVIHERVRRFTLLYLIFYTAMVLFVPIYYFTQFIYIMELICFLVGMYTILKVSTLTFQKNPETLFLTVAGMIYMSCGTHDTMVHNNILIGDALEYLPVGFLVFLVCESIVIAKKHVQALEGNETALLRIETMAKKELEVELKFLKSQIKPHFIHNALNAIISVSRANPDEARVLLVEFSQYLRNSFAFDNLDNMVSLEQEIQFVKSYISIEKARFGERLTVHYNIEEVNIMIPPLVLQPLVENAVVHGIRGSLGEVDVLVYVRCFKNKIKIGVMDNGNGMSDVNIKELSEGKGIGSGVGLNNINQRLQKLYGTSLHIKNLEGAGCDISMSLPYSRGDGTNENYDN